MTSGVASTPDPGDVHRSGPAVGIAVCAPGRLHLGFIDPAATLGRRFGSIGLVVDGFETEVRLGASDIDRATAADPAAADELGRARSHLELLRRQTGRAAPLHLHLQRVLPAHAGFGSGTQLALAVGRAFCALHGLDVATPLLARWLGRGLRSGIGIAGFDSGGLLLDGGPGANGEPAPLLSRIPFPADWRVVVVLDPRQRGLSGEAERQALSTLPPLPRPAAAAICHHLLMQVLPAATDTDFLPFAEGLTHVQRLLGAHFAPAQHGSAYASPAVARVFEWIAARTGPGVATGQSSWGPTAFAVVPGASQAQALVDAIRAARRAAAPEDAALPGTPAGGLVADPALQVHVVGGRNHGATVAALPPPVRA